MARSVPVATDESNNYSNAVYVPIYRRISPSFLRLCHERANCHVISFVDISRRRNMSESALRIKNYVMMQQYISIFLSLIFTKILK